MISEDDGVDAGDLVITARADGRKVSIAIWRDHVLRSGRVPLGTFGVVLHDDNNFPLSDFLRVVFTNGHVGTVHVRFLALVR